MVSAVSGGGTVGLRYDPLGRLYEVTDTSGSQRRLYYDGADLVLEYAGTGALLRRFVHGPSAGDDALLWYEGSTVSNATRRHLHADRLGSIVAVTDYQGNLLAANAYDEFGVPDQNNIGRFQFTGQAWVPELGMFYYKARMYSPTLGRFMQTDPIGYGDGMNMYAYVGNDPVNGVDYWGLCEIEQQGYWIVNPNNKENREWIRIGPPIITNCDGLLDHLGDPMVGVIYDTAINGRFPVEPSVDLKDDEACEIVASQDGQILVARLNADVSFGGGFTGGVGVFENLETGALGFFWEVGTTLGAETPGASLTIGIRESVASFKGTGASLSATVAFLAGALAFDSRLSFIGFDLGLATPGLGGAFSITETNLFGCKVSPQR